MLTIENIPLFRTKTPTMVAAVATEAPAQPEPKPIVGTAETVSIHETDPIAHIGKVITQTEMNVLLDRGRNEGFEVWGQWLSDDWPCDWRVVKVVNGEVVRQA